MRWVIAAICLALAVPAAAQEKHFVDTGSTNYGAVTLDAFNRRIEDAAQEYLKKYPPGAVNRIVLFDSAFPLSVEEYKASGGYGVLLTSALSHDNTELPLANVYIGGTKLKFLGGISREVEPGSPTELAFGKSRTDSFWLVPANLFDSKLKITADFTKNRNGFSVGEAPPLPAFMAALPPPGTSGNPDAETLRKLVAREYPGFGITIAP